MLGLTWFKGAGRRAGPDKVFVPNGSYVRRNGGPLLDALSKIFARLDLTGTDPLSLLRDPAALVRVACRRLVMLAGRKTSIACENGIAEITPARRRD